MPSRSETLSRHRLMLASRRCFTGRTLIYSAALTSGLNVKPKHLEEAGSS